MVSKESDSGNKEFNAEKLEYFGNRDGVGIRKCDSIRRISRAQYMRTGKHAHVIQ